MQIALLQEKIAYHPMFLGIVSLVASVTLAVSDGYTRTGIVKAEMLDLQQSLTQVLPAGFADNDLQQDKVEIAREGGTKVIVYRARLNGKATGAVFKMSSRGYADEVVSLVGVDLDGRILGVRVLKHKETPGLGDKIETAKSSWIKSFEGKSLAETTAEKFAVKKDGGVFDQFAGATITPRAVVKSVKEGLQFYATHKAEIFAAAPAAKNGNSKEHGHE